MTSIEETDDLIVDENQGYLFEVSEEPSVSREAAEQVRREALNKELISARAQIYGDPTEIFIRQAQAWSGILGVEITAAQVALCMATYKMIRTAVTPDYSDNSEDVYGYMDIFTALVGDDMIHARSADEYAQEKVRRGR